MADENNKKKQGIPFKELPRHCKILRIVVLVLLFPGLIMTIIGTALGIAGIGVLFGGLLTFIVPALIVAIIDFKFEKKFQKEYEARKANPEAPQEEPKAVEPAHQEQLEPEPEPEPEPKPQPQPAPESWICPSCGSEVKGKFCPECGTKRPEPMAEPQPAPIVVEPEPEPVIEEQPVEEPVIEEPASVEESVQSEPVISNSGNPEKKSNKKGLIIVLVIVGILILCGGAVGGYFLAKNAMNKQNREDGPRDDDTSHYVAPSTSNTSRPASSSSAAQPSSSSPTPEKTPKEVMADICTNIYGRANYYEDNPENYDYWHSDSGFTTVVAWDLDESYLQAAVEYVVERLPDYLNNIDELHSGKWSDGLDGYFQNFVSRDEQTAVEVGSYFEDGVLNCQILAHFNI